MTRSPDLAAEIRVMDKIERAMAAVDDLPEAGQLRVRRWVAETYPYALPGGGWAVTAQGKDKLPGEPS